MALAYLSFQSVLERGLCEKTRSFDFSMPCGDVRGSFGIMSCMKVQAKGSFKYSWAYFSHSNTREEAAA